MVYSLGKKWRFLAVALTLSLVSDASAGLIQIQPIQVRMDDGSGGATVGYFEAETDKIFAQVGIDVQFLPLVTYDETDFLVLDNGAEVVSLFTGAGHGQNANSIIINMWFVNTISPATTFGIAFLSGNGVAIAGDVFSFNGGIGRLDTIAHEIGHNLGLPHTADDDPDNLMTAGSFRNIPSSLAEITPDGPGYDQLTSDQIATILDSPFVQAVPEPSTLALAGVGVGLLGLWRRRQPRRHAAV